MTLTWRRAARRPTYVCGYCQPRRVIAPGEPYVIFGARPFVRCVECATTRMGLEVPVELLREADADAEAPVDAGRVTDWKRRAAGDA